MYQLVCFPALTAQILLRVDNQALPTREVLLEQGIAGREGDTIVATFDDEVNAREHGLHLVEAGAVVAQEVGPGEGVEGREDQAGEEGRHSKDMGPMAAVPVVTEMELNGHQFGNMGAHQSTCRRKTALWADITLFRI